MWADQLLDPLGGGFSLLWALLCGLEGLCIALFFQQYYWPKKQWRVVDNIRCLPLQFSVLGFIGGLSIGFMGFLLLLPAAWLWGGNRQVREGQANWSD